MGPLGKLGPVPALRHRQGRRDVLSFRPVSQSGWGLVLLGRTWGVNATGKARVRALPSPRTKAESLCVDVGAGLGGVPGEHRVPLAAVSGLAGSREDPREMDGPPLP